MKSVSIVTALWLCANCTYAARSTRFSGIPAVKPLQTDVKIPIAFEPNLGQGPAGVSWLSNTPGRNLSITPTGASVALKDSIVRMKLTGASALSRSEGIDQLPSSSNYFIGNEPKQWHRAVPHFAKVRYRDVYPGIDVVYYSSGDQLEYDFVLSPGADPRRIELAYEGADGIRVNAAGDLIVSVKGREIRQLKPRVYQQVGASRIEVASNYRLRAGNRVEFALAKYDRSKVLVIDPVLQYSTYFGQEGYDVAVSVATDRTGDIYMTGVTTSGRLPAASSAQREIGGGGDAFIAKFTGAGDLLWVSYLGGRGEEIGRYIAVDSAGNSYVTGYTTSDNFPTQTPTTAAANGDLDAYLVKLSPNGQQFLFGTYIGGSGSDDGTAVAADDQGNAYVTGLTRSPNFPVRGGFQTGPAGGGNDTFVTKIATSRSSVIYSTYVGGNGDDLAEGIAIDAQGNAYVAGATTSTAFPVFGPMQTAPKGKQDVFVYKLDSTGASQVYSILFGGTQEDLGYRIAVDSSGAAYVLGYTNSPEFPVRSAVQSAPGGNYDAFVTKVSPAGDAFVYSTFLGGSGEDFGFGGIAVDAAGSAYVSGYTASPNFPIRNGIQTSFGGGKYDAFVARLAPAGNSLLYSTYIGGSGEDNAYTLALDRQGQVVLAGRTASDNLGAAKNSFVGDARGAFDIFLSRISADTSVNFIASSSTALTFAVRGGTETAPQTISLSTASTPVTFSAGSDQPWLTVTPANGTTPATLTLAVNSAALTPTSQNATVTINAPGATNSPLTIQVNLNQVAAPTIASITPNPITRGSADTPITVTGTRFQNGLTVRVNNTPVPSTFVNATTAQATIPGSVLSTAQALVITVFNADGTQSNGFQLPFASAGPTITSAGIVNAATNAAGPVSPGEIITIFGTGFGPDALTSSAVVNNMLDTQVTGVRVLFDGVAAPMLYAAKGQLSAVVPYAVFGRASVQLEVEAAGQKSSPVTLSVATASPGLFTVGANGTGQAVAANQDGTFNAIERPAAIGSVVTLYGTGEGIAMPAGPDGRIITGPDIPKPVQSVSVTVGGVAVPVEYVGSSPGGVLGALQINIRLPQGVQTGPAVPVRVNVGGATSREGVTISVQ